MSSKSKRLIILLIVLAAAVVLTLVISRREEKKEEIKNTDEIVLELDADSVTSLAWETEENKLAFHKEETWLYDDDAAFPVDEEKVTALLEQFTELGVTFKIENADDLSQYGLDDPECTIKITAGEKEHKIFLGAFSTMDEQRYISTGDGNVYLVEHDPLEDYDIELKDMVKDDTVPVISVAKEMQISGSQNYGITYEEDSPDTWCADDVYFTDGKPLDTSLVSSYLAAVSGLGLTEYVNYNVQDDELEQYGLNDPELNLTIEYEIQEDESTNAGTQQEDGQKTGIFELHIGRNPEDAKAAREKTEKEEETDADAADTTEEEEIPGYVRIGDSQIIYRITEAEYNTLAAASYSDFRHKAVLTASFDDIYQIDISLEGEEYTITSEEAKKEEDPKIWYLSGEELDITDLQNRISALRAADAESFTDETPTEKEEIRFTVYLNNETWPQIEVVLYRYDGSDCLAVVNKETFARIPRSQAVDLMEAVNAIVLNGE